MVFVSIGLRLRVEVEALNMVEALGAYTRHRTVSILKKVNKDGSIRYKILTAPAISGQSIANGYMRALVELGNLSQLNVCDECKAYETRGGFTKHGISKDKNLTHDKIVESCIVEDITGFMVPDLGIRRTSPVMFSYMVPDVESAKAMVESQFHVRYDFSTQQHQPFSIESGTAIYMLMIGIDASRIGELENGKFTEDREKRLEVAFKGISVLLESSGFGAKKARYLPIEEVVGGIAAISNPIPFSVSPPRVYPGGTNYICDTIARAEKYLDALNQLKEEIHIVYMDKERLDSCTSSKQNVEKADTMTEMLEKALQKTKNLLPKQKRD
jgi:CRISPR-associated protein Csa2